MAVEMKISKFGVFVFLGDFYGDLRFAQQLQKEEDCKRKEEEAKREAEEFRQLQVSRNLVLYITVYTLV